MKKLFTFVMAVFIGIAAYAQLPKNVLDVFPKISGQKADTVYTTWYLHDSTYEYSYNTSTQTLELASKTIVSYTDRTYDFYESYNVDSNGNFKLSAQILFSWDTLKRIIRKETRMSPNDTLMPYYLDSITYLGTTNLEQEIVSFSYDTLTNSWVYRFKNIYTYNANNLKTEWLYLSWQSNQWNNQFRYIYAYDNNNNMISKLYQQWVNSQWEDNTKETYAYDANGNLIENTYMMYNTTTQVFDTVYKSDYQYDANNLLLSSIRYVYQNNQKFPAEKKVYVYSNGLLMRDTVFSYDTASASWNYSMLEEYTYNTDQDPIEFFVQYWDGNQWVNYIKVNVTYTLNQPVEKGVTPFEGMFGSLKTIPFSTTFYLWNNNAWLEWNKAEFYFSPYTEWRLSDVPSLEIEGMSIYPNPAVDYIVVDMNGRRGTVQFIDMSGQVVKSIETTNNVISVGDLPRGLYIVKFTRDNQTFVGKMIKQ